MATEQPPLLGSLNSAFERRSSLYSSLKDGADGWFPDDPPPRHGLFRRCLDWIMGLGPAACEIGLALWEFGRSDPRKVIFAAKAGLALAIISLLVFLDDQEFFSEDLGKHYVWAILTVVVVFEFSVGATLSKGLNRGLGTLTAGGLALCCAELSTFMGEFKEIFLVISIFIAGFIATYLKLYPTLRAYEYGFRVFLITFCYVMVSGYRTNQFIEMATSRFLLIVLGAAVGYGVNILVYPIWAGEDLHGLVGKNFIGVAKSLEGCVNGYLQCFEYERIPSKILTYQAHEDHLYSGYRSAVQSTSQEDSLLGFAIWEPPHGRYKMWNYPWKSYIKLSGALRHCAFTVMALHGCILSEIQAPPEFRQIFASELQKVGTEGSKLLRELGLKVSTMTKLTSSSTSSLTSPSTSPATSALTSADALLAEVHQAAEELQKKIDRKSYLLVDYENWEELLIKRKGENGEGIGEVNQEQLGELKSMKSMLHTSYTRFDSSSSAMEKIFRTQSSWPARRSFHPSDSLLNIEESKTYESASALSLATFASLLIEFVARLQNLVNAFEELSEKANFKEPGEESELGFWAKVLSFFGYKR